MAESCDKPLRVPFVGWEGRAYGSMEGDQYRSSGEKAREAYLVFHAEFTYQVTRVSDVLALRAEILLPFP